MSTLALQLVGPMQSYGMDAAHTNRRTRPFPTKSAVVGMLAAQLGIGRMGDVSALAELKMHVRLDDEGALEYDFHTVRGIRRASGTIDDKANLVKKDFYLADAAFLVVLEGDGDLLRQIEAALSRPAFFTYLGRKSYLPSRPLLHSGVQGGDALTRLVQTPPLRGQAETLHAVLEDLTGDDLIGDQPLSLTERTYRATRRVTLILEDKCISAA